MKKDPRADTALFTFCLTPTQAQTLFNVHECMKDERALFRAIWRTPADRARANGAMRRFSKQLNNQYAATGIEV